MSLPALAGPLILTDPIPISGSAEASHGFDAGWFSFYLDGSANGHTLYAHDSLDCQGCGIAGYGIAFENYPWRPNYGGPGAAIDEISSPYFNISVPGPSAGGGTLSLFDGNRNLLAQAALNGVVTEISSTSAGVQPSVSYYASYSISPASASNAPEPATILSVAGLVPVFVFFRRRLLKQ